MISLLLVLSGQASAQSADVVLTCGQTYTDNCFDCPTNRADDDCPSYGVNGCDDPAVVPSPDLVIEFDPPVSTTNYYVDWRYTYASELHMGPWVHANSICNSTRSCPNWNFVTCTPGADGIPGNADDQGYDCGWGPLTWYGGFYADAGDTMYLTFELDDKIDDDSNEKAVELEQFNCCPDADGDGGYYDPNGDCATLDDDPAAGSPPGDIAGNREDDCDDADPDNTYPNDFNRDGVLDDRDPGWEFCDGKDNDCDGTPDNGRATTAWFKDYDGDGYGDDSTSIQSCGKAALDYLYPANPPTDAYTWVNFGGDCDESNSQVNPGMAEICDGLDQDCALGADNGLLFLNWWPDIDQDGYGDKNDSSAPVFDCKGPTASWINDGTDCDDTNVNINPGATEVCNTIDDDCDTQVDEFLLVRDWYPDADGDGYGDENGSLYQSCETSVPNHVENDNTDCDDTKAAVNPMATEVCNAIDDNCNTAVDEGFVYRDWRFDNDGDGYGAGTIINDCASPGQGWVDPTDEDCNDVDNTIYPGAPELCDSKDNDCNGVPDDNITYQNFYLDADTDGWGVGSPIQDCTAPPGYAAKLGDCDDATPSVNPDATEVCNTIDDDCDSQIDENLTTTYWLDADGDTYGDPNSPVALCTPPTDGSSVLNSSDCDDSATDANGDTVPDGRVRNPGATEICDGIDNDCNTATPIDVGTQCYDDDGDGFSELGGDCDDSSAAISPIAIETCDQVDQDCDTFVDNDTECFDDDGDGETELEGDCNDGDPGVHTGQTEIAGDGVDNNCDGVTDADLTDNDADGYADNVDCDDDDATVYPGAPELEDGIDNDCDSPSVIDEGTLAYDDDGDGVSENDGDCDDENAAVNPGADDVQDGVDNDCDDLIDEGSDWTDDDGDGWSEADGDCDDTDAGISPDAKEKDDDVDNDCDGSADEGFADLDNDGVTEEDGDCNDNDGWIRPDAVEDCGNGVDENCNGQIDEGCSEGGNALSKSGSCSCTSAPSGVGVFALLPGLLLLRRRR